MYLKWNIIKSHIVLVGCGNMWIINELTIKPCNENPVEVEWWKYMFTITMPGFVFSLQNDNYTVDIGIFVSEVN